MLVVNLRQGIEDLQAEIGHLLPWFTSHVNPDFKSWKEENGVVAVPAAELDDDDLLDQRDENVDQADLSDAAAQGGGGDRLQRSRARNKLHARKSRQRKKLLMESLKHESSILSQQVALMKAEISKKLGGSHPCLSWTPPEREPVCLDDDDDFDVADDVSPAPSHFSSTRAMQGSAIQDEPERQIRGTKRARSNTSDSTTDVQGADALLQLAAAASSARDVEMRSKQHRPSGPPTPSSPYGGMDALLSAAQASGGSGTLSRQRSGSEARSPRSAIPSSAVGAPPQQPVAWHNDASSGFDSTYTAQSSTNSTRAASRPQAAPRPDTAPVADAAQADAAAPRFHLTPRTTGMQPSAPAPVSGHAQVAQVAASSSGLPAGKYKVVTNMDTLPADMKASIQNAMAQHQGGHASLPAYSAAPQHPQLDAGGQPPAHPGAMYMHAQAPTHAPPRHPQYNNFMQPSMHDLYMMHGGGAAGYGGQQGMMQSQQPTHPGFHSMSYSGMQQPQQQAVQGQYTHSPHMQGMHMGQVSFQPVGHAHGGFMPPHQMYAAAHAQGQHTSM